MKRQWILLGLTILVSLTGASFLAKGFLERATVPPVSYVLSQENMPDSVDVIVTKYPSESSSIGSVVFHQQFSDQAANVYLQLVKGELVAPDIPAECPGARSTSPYYHYNLVFRHTGITVAAVHADGYGCAYLGIKYSNGQSQVYSWYASDGTSFWYTLHQLTNAPIPSGYSLGKS